MNKKTSALITALLCAITLLAFPGLTGCQSTPSGQGSVTYNSSGDITGTGTVNVNSNVAVGGTGTYNTNTGAWSAGVVVVFKAEPPAYVVGKLKAAQAVPYTRGSQLVWKIAKANPKSPALQDALVAALSVPGVMITPDNR